MENISCAEAALRCAAQHPGSENESAEQRSLSSEFFFGKLRSSAKA